MITIKPLNASQSWRGKFYKKGATQIPEDLAIALGLAPQPDPETKSPTVGDLPDRGEEAIAQPTEQTEETGKTGASPPPKQGKRRSRQS